MVMYVNGSMNDNKSKLKLFSNVSTRLSFAIFMVNDIGMWVWQHYIRLEKQRSGMLTNILLCIQGSGEYSSTNSSCPQCPSRCGMPTTTAPGVDWSTVGAGGGSGSGGGSSNRDRQTNQQVRQLFSVTVLSSRCLWSEINAEKATGRKPSSQ